MVHSLLFLALVSPAICYPSYIGCDLRTMPGKPSFAQNVMTTSSNVMYQPVTNDATLATSSTAEFTSSSTVTIQFSANFVRGFAHATTGTFTAPSFTGTKHASAVGCSPPQTIKYKSGGAANSITWTAPADVSALSTVVLSFAGGPSFAAGVSRHQITLTKAAPTTSTTTESTTVTTTEVTTTSTTTEAATTSSTTAKATTTADDGSTSSGDSSTTTDDSSTTSHGSSMTATTGDGSSTMASGGSTLSTTTFDGSTMAGSTSMPSDDGSTTPGASSMISTTAIDGSTMAGSSPMPTDDGSTTPGSSSTPIDDGPTTPGSSSTIPDDGSTTLASTNEAATPLRVESSLTLTVADAVDFLADEVAKAAATEGFAQYYDIALKYITATYSLATGSGNRRLAGNAVSATYVIEIPASESTSIKSSITSKAAASGLLESLNSAIVDKVRVAKGSGYVIAVTSAISTVATTTTVGTGNGLEASVAKRLERLVAFGCVIFEVIGL